VRRVNVVVTGRVQGVFYRASCADRARAAGLGGWVRNRPDGAVEAEFEGPTERVEAILAWCRQGPPSAHVDEVLVSDREPAGERGFRVMH
jgi:acylphosphatase